MDRQEPQAGIAILIKDPYVRDGSRQICLASIQAAAISLKTKSRERKQKNECIPGFAVLPPRGGFVLSSSAKALATRHSCAFTNVSAAQYCLGVLDEQDPLPRVRSLRPRVVGPSLVPELVVRKGPLCECRSSEEYSSSKCAFTLPISSANRSVYCKAIGSATRVRPSQKMVKMPMFSRSR
jgi:hypothetical protein